jgi:tetratricopeptide (TPR) repeat protein
MKTTKLKNLFLTVLVIAVVINAMVILLVYAAQTISGAERLEAGIDNIKAGRYEEAIIDLEVAIWEMHIYLGFSYYLSGENEKAKNEFNKAKGIIKNKLPDPGIFSPKIVKIFKGELNINKSTVSIDDLLDVAIQLYREEEFEAAIEKWKEVLALDPSKIEAKFNIEIAQDRIKERRSKASGR